MITLYLTCEKHSCYCMSTFPCTFDCSMVVLPAKAICTFHPYNCRKAINSQEDIRDDINKLLSYFGEMKACNKEFFFDFQLDDENRIKNIFWAPASCRGSYEDFRDCITFDTTYKTNRHSMPLGVFVGVNHHLQSTIFACALVRDESEDSFYWLFRTFLRCMNGKQPTIILTGLFTHILLHISVRTYSIVNNIHLNRNSNLPASLMF